MPDIDIRRAHGMGMREARAAAETMAEHLGQRFQLRGKWRGDALDFERPGVTGTLAISDHEVHLTVTLGFLLRAMKGTIRDAVEGEMDRLFAAPAAKARKPARPAPTQRRAAPPPKKGA